MTRFNRDLTGRVERGLSQISDRATPSSTAWEAIQHRIDEQDSQPHREQTMEVIMLDPETNRLDRRPRTGMLVAASVAAIALVGGLVVVANRDDDTSPADRPDPVPTVAVTDPAIAGDPQPVAEPEALPTSGNTVFECVFGGGGGGGGGFLPLPGGYPESTQDCEGSDDGSVVPFDRVQNFTAGRIDGQGVDRLVGVSEQGALYAGTSLTAGLLKFVAVYPGTEDFEGESIYVVGNSPGNGQVEMNWYTADGPPPFGPVGDFELTAEVTFECRSTPGENDDPDVDATTETCTYAGDDALLVPAPGVAEVETFDTSLGADAIDGARYFLSNSDGGTSRGGLVDDNGVRRWIGVTSGTGELRGVLIEEVGWSETDGNGVTTGVIRYAARPVRE